MIPSPPWKEQFPDPEDRVRDELRRIKRLKAGILPDITKSLALWCFAAALLYAGTVWTIYAWRYPSLTSRELLLELPKILTLKDLE